MIDLVGVAVGVEDGDHRDAQLAGLVDGEVLLLGVDDPDGLGKLAHVTDTAEVLGQLVLLAREHEQLFLGQAGAAGLVEVHGLELLEAGDALGDGLEVGEHATEPTLVDVGHANPARLLGDGLLGLLLRADEEDLTTLGHGLLDEGVGLVDVGQRLVQVDDVDAIALGEDETLHLRVPATGLVSEVNSALEQLTSGDDGHDRVLP